MEKSIIWREGKKKEVLDNRPTANIPMANLVMGEEIVSSPLFSLPMI